MILHAKMYLDCLATIAHTRINQCCSCLFLGGIITLQDLQSYTAPFKNPVNVTIQNGQYFFYNPPPPASGAVINFIVNILDGRSIDVCMHVYGPLYNALQETHEGARCSSYLR